MSPQIIDSDATFSACGRYRYRLWRLWDASKPVILWVMLNPSTADHRQNDPTVERCLRRSVAGGFGKMLVGNLFALRSTDPKALYDADDPVGPGNADALLAMAREAQTVVCGWGQHGSLLRQDVAVKSLLRDAGITLSVLRLTKTGQPAHPLYLPYSCLPAPWVSVRHPPETMAAEPPVVGGA